MTPAPINTPMFLPNGTMSPVWSQWFAALQTTIEELRKQVTK